MLSRKKLESWLAREVLGKKPPQLAYKAIPKKRKGPPRKGPARSEDYKAWIKQQPSVLSGQYGCDPAHTGKDGGMSMKASDYSCIPLTRAEHEQYHQLGRERFARRHGLRLGRLVRELNRAYRLERGRGRAA